MLLCVCLDFSHFGVTFSALSPGPGWWCWNGKTQTPRVCRVCFVRAAHKPSWAEQNIHTEAQHNFIGENHWKIIVVVVVARIYINGDVIETVFFVCYSHSNCQSLSVHLELYIHVKCIIIITQTHTPFHLPLSMFCVCVFLVCRFAQNWIQLCVCCRYSNKQRL